MNKTKIEWALNPDGTPGYTWNPITGCLNGCEYCYARKLANTRLRERYLANDNLAPTQDKTVPNMHLASEFVDPFYPRFWEDRLNEPLRVLKPRGIFTCDMSDLFGIGVPEEWTNKVMEVIKTDNYLNEDSPHRFYLLTKQPQNLIKFSPFPDNCWVGVSVTNEPQYVGAYGYLKDVEAKVKFYSFEPLLERVRVSSIGLDRRVQWVIIGSQTRPYKPPKIEWVQEIVQACDKAGIPVFLKNNLWDLVYTEAWDNDLFWANDKATLRQKMPLTHKKDCELK